MSPTTADYNRGYDHGGYNPSPGDHYYSNQEYFQQRRTQSEAPRRPRASPRQQSYQSSASHKHKSKLDSVAKAGLAVAVLGLAANFVHIWMKKRHAEREAQYRRDRRFDFERAKAKRRRDEEMWERQQEEREREEERRYQQASGVSEAKMIGYAKGREPSRSRSRKSRHPDASDEVDDDYGAGNNSRSGDRGGVRRSRSNPAIDAYGG